MPCSVLTVFIHFCIQHSEFLQRELDIGRSGATILGAFTGILGFLIVFRSQQAYSRWWNGGTLLQQICGEWVNAFSALLAFSNTSPEKKDEVEKFHHLLVRLVSLLHGAALHHVSTIGEQVFELIDLDGFDQGHLSFMQSSHDPCQIVLQWIQKLIVEANAQETLKIAP